MRGILVYRLTNGVYGDKNLFDMNGIFIFNRYRLFNDIANLLVERLNENNQNSE